MPRTPDECKYRISEKFQARMKALLEEEDLTKKEFAIAAKVNKEVIIRATVYAIVPSVKSLIKICDFLNCPILYLLGETDERSLIPALQSATFYERLEALTKERSLKYSALAHAMSFAPNSIYEWIRTNSLPSLDYLKELSDFFGVSIDYLLGRTDYRN